MTTPESELRTASFQNSNSLCKTRWLPERFSGESKNMRLQGEVSGSRWLEKWAIPGLRGRGCLMELCTVDDSSLKPQPLPVCVCWILILFFQTTPGGSLSPYCLFPMLSLHLTQSQRMRGFTSASSIEKLLLSYLTLSYVFKTQSDWPWYYQNYISRIANFKVLLLLSRLWIILTYL